MDRCKFTYLTAWGSSIGLSAPQAFGVVGHSDNPILVVILLTGGNDGLNTVAPIDNDYYYKARPKISIKPLDALKINDSTGLRPRLTGLKSVYDEGRLAIIEGIGYPNPSRSHYRSTEIRHTGSDSKAETAPASGESIGDLGGAVGNTSGSSANAPAWPRGSCGMAILPTQQTTGRSTPPCLKNIRGSTLPPYP